MRQYDLVVIGSGPGGQKAAIAAAKLGKTVVVIERSVMLTIRSAMSSGISPL